MTDSLPRRDVLGGALAAMAAGALPAAAAPHLRGDSSERLPNHAALWARMPLPFTPAEAWRLLSPETQAEIGAAVIGMALADYVSGDMHEDAVDLFLDGDLRCACRDARDETMGQLEDRLWALFPDLYGPDGDHPGWALDGGFVRPLPA